MLIDTHCHLDFPAFADDRDEVLARARSQGVERFINAGSSLEGSKKSLELARKYDCIFATAGIHPHEADQAAKEDVLAIRALAGEEKVVAVGEIGLDYFKNFSKAGNQRRLFISLLEVAKETGLPLVIHTRDAAEDTLKILKEAMPLQAVVHCFSGDSGFLSSCLQLGFYVSFTCNITYNKAQNLRELVKAVPLERLMLETDAPYLAPRQSRGKRNEPANVAVLADYIAALRGMSVADLARATCVNAEKFFHLK